ncbi:MAG: SAM-dependent methyltransferase [Bacteroidetes bacterium]|nr:MAG: SAM-dependent methyltransferase [Bacteroidota bacterium]
MNLYDKYILPKVVHWACNGSPSRKQRQKIIPKAKGNVLEIGIGSGLNLPFYNSNKVKNLTAIDPSEEIWGLKPFDIKQLDFDFKFLKAFAEDIPLKNEQFDTIVITYTLCTIKDTKKAFDEIKRLLKPNGQLLFCEHGVAPDNSIKMWQNTINPVWKRVGGGCNLNKEIPELITSNGFKIVEMETMYLPGWKPASYNYWGVAVRNDNF